MALDSTAYLHQLQALLPPGKAWSRNPASDITSVLEGIAPELARVQVRSEDILREMNPGEAGEMLPEHEDLNGVVASGTTEDRQAALLAKLQDTSGHNPEDYAAWALAGYGITGLTVTRRPLPPMVAGFEAGDRCRGEEWAHLYFVHYMADILTPAANDVAAWTEGAGVTSTANVIAGPDGSSTADLVSFPSSTNVGTFGAISSSDATMFSVWLRRSSGSAPLAVSIAVSNGGITLSTPIEVTDRWTRYEMRSSVSAATSVGIHRNADSPASTFGLHAWGAYVGDVNSSFETDFMNRQQSHSIPIFRVQGDSLEKD